LVGGACLLRLAPVAARENRASLGLNGDPQGSPMTARNQQRWAGSLKIPLVCHWRGDGDIAEAFLNYYSSQVSGFHLILHGPEEENRAILDLRSRFAIVVHDSYDGLFDDGEKARRLNALLPKFMGEWVLLVDSDEFVELPHSSVGETIDALERSRLSCLAAPMLQRLRSDGSLKSPEIVRDPFAEFPLCSERLYGLMGSSTACIGKYPLFRIGPETVVSIGNHGAPNGADSACDAFIGVTHHFKWKRSAIDRISHTIEAGWQWAGSESALYLKYLGMHDFTLPLDDSFAYSRRALCERGLLKRPRYITTARIRCWAKRRLRRAKKVLRNGLSQDTLV
jgi:Glycosyl transferase family 2